MTREIRPLFKAPKCAAGPFTVKSRPADKTPPAGHTQEYTDWANKYWYGEVAVSPWVEELQPGDIVVIEGHDLNIGEASSNNSLGWRAKGAGWDGDVRWRPGQ